MAEEGRDSWMKHGALGYYECRGDNLIPQDMGGGKARAFTEMTGANNDEVHTKVLAEMKERMKDLKDMQMPFDIKRMAYGGFQVEVEG